jgi:thiosulfate dehydrogenase [quinone] large subunit
VPVRPAFRLRPDSVWAARLTDPGWLLLPLRGFLGLTFCYAGLQKLANPAYLDAHNPTSAAGQMRLLRHSSPIGGLLGLSLHAPVLIGLVIAIGELAVGVGTLLGLFTRVAALGGLALSLTFFLTVSWNTTPYYYGSDIVFAFAWVTLFAFGTGDVLSLETWAAARARRGIRLRAGRVPPRLQEELDRRTVVQKAGIAALVGAATALTGGLTAAIGRAVGGTRSGTPAAAPPTHSAASTPTSSSPAAAAGTPIGAASAVALGQARSFTDPASGAPAWVVHASAGSFVAFSAVCTHAGCPVQFDASNEQFVCPCHGGLYDARTGRVLAGPPPAPLQQIPVRVVGGQLRVDG